MNGYLWYLTQLTKKLHCTGSSDGQVAKTLMYRRGEMTVAITVSPSVTKKALLPTNAELRSYDCAF